MSPHVRQAKAALVRKLKLSTIFGTTQEPPTFNVATLAPILQMLMTTKPDELARQAEFIVRQKTLSGADFLQGFDLRLPQTEDRATRGTRPAVGHLQAGPRPAPGKTLRPRLLRARAAARDVPLDGAVDGRVARAAEHTAGVGGVYRLRWQVELLFGRFKS